MGCVPSKLVSKEVNLEKKLHVNGEYGHHVVSLTSSTYGVLKLDKEKEIQQKEEMEIEVKKQSSRECVARVKKSLSPSLEEPSEIINAWELMEDLEEGVPVVIQSKRSPKSRIFDARSPLKFLNQMGSPRKAKKAGGKENSPKTVLKEGNNFKKPSPRLWASIKGSPNGKRCDSLRYDSSGVVPSRRRNLGSLFDPQVSVSRNVGNASDSHAILESYEEKCPPGGEGAVVIYTTTLRGIRKTFEECNVARSIIESQNVRMFERDVSMHSTFKEELRALIGGNEVRVPLLFVRGRLIGGAEEMVRLDEEGKLCVLLGGIPKAGPDCAGCGGIRFVMCMECSGSCKVLGEDRNKRVRCDKCNENGLVQCSICCL